MIVRRTIMTRMILYSNGYRHFISFLNRGIGKFLFPDLVPGPSRLPSACCPSACPSARPGANAAAATRHGGVRRRATQGGDGGMRNHHFGDDLGHYHRKTIEQFWFNGVL